MTLFFAIEIHRKFVILDIQFIHGKAHLCKMIVHHENNHRCFEIQILQLVLSVDPY